MTLITFKTISNDGKNIIVSDNAKKSITMFLNKYKNRKFSIKEYHNGSFTAQWDGESLSSSMLYKSFNSRREALEYANKMKK